MAWYDEVADIQQYAAFTQYLGDDRAAIKMMNFAGCTLTTIGHNFKGKSPLQTKDRDVRAVEICIQFADQKWFILNAPKCVAMIDDIGKTTGRDAKQFQEKHDLAVQRGYDLRALLVTEIGPTLKKINPVIERLWAGFLEETGGTRDGVSRVVDQREALKQEATEALRELRKHQKEKVNKHAYGNYTMSTNMLDGEPLLLISSAFNVDIDPEYLAIARKYGTQHTKTSVGLYRQAGDALTEFEQHTGTCTQNDFRDAMKALRATRSAILVDQGTIDKKKPAKTGHGDQAERDQLTLLGDLRSTHKDNLKKFEEGQFWATAEAADGDPLIAVSKGFNKPVPDLDKLAMVKKTATTAEASGKWYIEAFDQKNFYYEFTTGTLTTNSMVNALKAARVTNIATPSIGALDAFRKQREAEKKKRETEEKERLAAAKKKK